MEYFRNIDLTLDLTLILRAPDPEPRKIWRRKFKVRSRRIALVTSRTLLLAMEKSAELD